MDHPLSTQRWRNVAFLHWEVEPRIIARMLPEGLEPDVREGVAWVTLTPFHMRSVRLGPFPPLPRISAFPETNVRTYVRSADGSDGVFFLSVDCGELLVVISLRALRLPYTWSRMSVDRRRDVVRYVCDRRPPGSRPRSSIEVCVGDELAEEEQTELDDWLSGRWHTYTKVFGELIRVPVSHEPWPLHRAELVTFDDELMPTAGFDGLAPPTLVRFSPGVDAKVARPRIVALS